VTVLHSIFAVLSAIILFIYGLQGFSRELQAAGGAALQSWLERVTKNRMLGFSIGAFATVFVQSSSAITSLTVALVDASVLSFRASLSVLLGANVGTTVTAWLVAFKLTEIGPIFIVLGALISATYKRMAILGKAIFYFGLIFFALDLISAALKPISALPIFIEWISLAGVPILGILIGFVFTAIVQSSSVTTGVAILLSQQGVLPAEAAISIVVGANIGSTSTALLASVGMNNTARATAKANFVFNLVGGIIFYPFLQDFGLMIVGWIKDPGMSVAVAHLIFNLTIALFIIILLDWVEPPLHKLLMRPNRD